jgi:hypothetical protein
MVVIIIMIISSSLNVIITNFKNYTHKFRSVWKSLKSVHVFVFMPERLCSRGPKFRTVFEYNFIQFVFRKVLTVYFCRPRVHKSRPPGARATKFCTVAPNICGSSVSNLLHVTLLAPWIFRWRLIFCGSSVSNLLHVTLLAPWILRWRLIFVGPQYLTCFMWPFWRLEYWGGA